MALSEGFIRVALLLVGIAFGAWLFAPRFK